jgi:hypothetical protein
MEIIEGKKFPAKALAVSVNVSCHGQAPDVEDAKILRIREVLKRKIVGETGETVETSLMDVDRILRS